MSTASRSDIPIALLASSNLELFAGELRRELRLWGWDGSLWVSGFNQYRQDIWNPDSQLYASRPKAVILYLDGEDLFQDILRNPFAHDREERARTALAAAAEVASYVKKLQEHLPAATVVLNTVYLPPIHALTGLEYHTSIAVSDLVSVYNAQLSRISEEHPSVLVHDVAALAASVGYQAWSDPRLWYLARCRLGREGMKSLAQSTAALLRGWLGQARKCVVVDLDNTLWGGVIGEDGIEQIVLGEEGLGLAYAEFQEELLNLTRKGILLAICSKNNEEDALAVFRQHPSMRLKEDHFAARRINWKDKAANLRELADELNLGVDSFVFLDDNPAERSLVRTALPEVLVPEWPEDPTLFKTALLELARHHLLKVSLTPEDRARTSMYRAEGQRRFLQASSSNLEEYYRSLHMTARIGCADAFSIPRIAQLTQRTNQFNLTTRRYSEADIHALATAPNSLVLWLALRDRYSDSGLVGVLILRQTSAKRWLIDTFLLSCRVIGRKVENAFLAVACEALLEREAEELVGEYVPTKKNGLAATVYPDLGFEPAGGDDGVTRWCLPLRGRPVKMPDCVTVEFPKEMARA